MSPCRRRTPWFMVASFPRSGIFHRSVHWRVDLSLPPWGLAILVALMTWGAAPSARAQRVHEVREGQTLSHIAHQHHVTVASLRAANGLASGDMLKPGQLLTVPQRGVIHVQRGQTLSHIARKHDITVAELARANSINKDATLREGQRLLLPGFEAAADARRAARRWGRPDRPGELQLVRIATKERLRMRLLDRKGQVRPAGQERVSNLLRDRKTGKRHRIHPTLLRLLTRISDHFGGRTIYVISGYRAAEAHRHTREGSRHTMGRAIDFRIAGVPNEALRDYCRKLGNVGVGYYPRSTFVHLDVRNKPTYWVDWSRPGEPPQYRRASRAKPADDDVAEGADEGPAAN
jgi:uncharacterized protein YcbK (DUF882 family)